MTLNMSLYEHIGNVPSPTTRRPGAANGDNRLSVDGTLQLTLRATYEILTSIPAGLVLDRVVATTTASNRSRRISSR